MTCNAHYVAMLYYKYMLNNPVTGVYHLSG